MRKPGVRLLLIGLGVTLVGVLVGWQLVATRAQSGSCTTGVHLEETLPTGAR